MFDVDRRLFGLTGSERPSVVCRWVSSEAWRNFGARSALLLDGFPRSGNGDCKSKRAHVALYMDAVTNEMQERCSVVQLDTIDACYELETEDANVT